jgi:hypothetical protein
VGYSVADKDIRAVIHTKCNNGPIMPGLGFYIEGVDGEFGGKRVEWTGVAEIDESHILGSPHLGGFEKTKEPAGEKRLYAMDMLRTLLSDGPKNSKEIEMARIEAGISTPTLNRARADLKIKKVADGQRGTADQKFLWGFAEQFERRQQVESD